MLVLKGSVLVGTDGDRVVVVIIVILALGKRSLANIGLAVILHEHHR